MYSRIDYKYNTAPTQSTPAFYWQRVGLTLSYPYHN